MLVTNVLLLVIIGILVGWSLWVHQHHNELLRYFDAFATMVGDLLDERNE